MLLATLLLPLSLCLATEPVAPRHGVAHQWHAQETQPAVHEGRAPCAPEHCALRCQFELSDLSDTLFTEETRAPASPLPGAAQRVHCAKGMRHRGAAQRRLPFSTAPPGAHDAPSAR